MIVKKVLTVIQVLLVLIFVGCVGYIGKYFYDSHQAQNKYDELKQIVAETAQEVSDGYIEKRAENGMLEQYYELYKQNNHMVGWIRIKDTIVDYPVVQYTDNEYYLHKDFNKKYQYSGIPFLDYQSTEGAVNNIIYAHHMRDGSMFAVLDDYQKNEFYEEHKVIEYDTLYDTAKYDVMSVFTTKVGAKDEFKYHEYADITTEERFNEYVSKAKTLSKIDTGVTAKFGDELLTLSTCTYHASNERIVVVAKKRKNT